MTDSLTVRGTLRLLFDLQACQSPGSAQRGVGRYSQSLFNAVGKQLGQRELFALLSGALSFQPDLSAIPPDRCIRMPPLPDWPTGHVWNGGERQKLDALCYSAFVAPWRPDVIHVSHACEVVRQISFPDPMQMGSGQVLSATLYDIIPLIFQDHYLIDSGVRRWYLSRMAWLKKADLLLAISEASRRDAINWLGIEPWRIVTIWGGLPSSFMAEAAAAPDSTTAAKTWGIQRPYVLYTGGDDWRKNLGGAIAAFAQLPGELRSRHQLVIVCHMSEESKSVYKRQTELLGLADNDVVFTGFVPDADLRAFYAGCDAFIFPSCYEGLGLPILEAMVCGAPVIGGDNSSIREIIVRQDALFDAHSSDDTAMVLHHVLTDRAFADDLRSYGLLRAKEFSFERTGRLALEAFDEAVRRKRHAGVTCVVEGWQPRKRLAFLTPLPPAKSGIASYSTELLPHLARYFDIDVYIDGQTVSDDYCRSAFRIYHYSDFEAVAGSYDFILYEFGNSDFHAHMFGHLSRFPGVVTLHDAYLGNILNYINYILNQLGLFQREMLYSHGPRARRRLNASPNQDKNKYLALIDLPCTKRVLDQAMGVISHSPFNLAIAREQYPEGFRTPYRIINMPLALPPEISEQEREAIRRELGIPESVVVIASFGHISFTKRGDLLLQSITGSALAGDDRLQLVFVGQLAEDDFGRNLQTAIKGAGIRERIRITGFVNDKEYRQWLSVADIAVQLREHSRGGTPKGSLDCLASGVPLILNDYASYTDYPDDILCKISHPIHVGELAAAIGELAGDPELRRKLGAAGREYVRQHHDPAQCAAQYAAALHDFYSRCRLERVDALTEVFGPHLDARNNQHLGTLAARRLSGFSRPQFSRRRIHIDVTHIANKDFGSGIQRVVKEIVRELYHSDATGVEPMAIRFDGDRFVSATQWLSANSITIKDEHPCNGSGETGGIAFQPGDILLMLDSSWRYYDNMAPHFQTARDNGTTIISVVYDILSLLMPDAFVPGESQWFEKCFLNMAKESDVLLGISRTSVDAVRQWLGESHPGLLRKLVFSHWHLGTDFGTDGKAFPSTQRTECLRNAAYLLMVGTVEPRKNHALALEAISALWNRGVELSLCIAGKEGWLVDDLMRRLRNNTNPRLVFIENPSDRELSWLYSHAKGLLFVSKGEGFGLPLIEAASCGTPVVCSDIPVFHEIAGDFATYARIGNAVCLAEDIEAWWKRAKQGNIPDSYKMPRLTWEESAHQLLDAILG